MINPIPFPMLGLPMAAPADPLFAVDWACVAIALVLIASSVCALSLAKSRRRRRASHPVGELRRATA